MLENVILVPLLSMDFNDIGAADGCGCSSLNGCGAGTGPCLCGTANGGGDGECGTSISKDG